MLPVMRFTIITCLLLTATSIRAELIGSGEHGFTTSHSIITKAQPLVVYRAMTNHIDQWWSADHSWSGDAGNLYMEVELGGCFCERLPNGGHVEHLRIIYFSPGKGLRFEGALGPLQTMAVQGRMVWKIEALEIGSKVSFTYHVFGHPQGGLAGIAPAVDGVIGEQLSRLGERLNNP